jgi:sugar phosphate isomerase/epimerase
LKLGFHCFTLVERWSDETLWVLDRAPALGATCVEISLGDDVAFDVTATRRRANALGLSLTTSPGGMWPVECDLSVDDPAQRALGLEWHKRHVDTAAALGAVAYTGALYGHPGTILRRIPPMGEPERIAAGLHALAAHGASLGVEIVLEPMSHFRTHIANTPAQAMHLIALADHPTLSLLDRKSVV